MSIVFQSITDHLVVVSEAFSKKSLGRRMTIIRLPNNDLILHSCIHLDGPLKQKVDDLGKVTTILIPNEWHTRDAQRVQAQYPDAKIIVPNQALARLSKSFANLESIDTFWDDALSNVVSVHHLDGLTKPEVVLYHSESKTLIATDVFFNFNEGDFTGVFKWLMGLNNALSFGVTRFYRWAMVTDKLRFKASLQWMMDHWKIERVILSHGHLIEYGASGKLSHVIGSL